MVNPIRKNETFNRGDPFAFVIMFLSLFLLLVAILTFIVVISAAYALHPPLAIWIMSKLR